MKVLMCTGRYYMGGIEKYVHDLSSHLSDSKVEVFLLVFYKIKRLVSIPEINNYGQRKEGQDASL